MAEIVLAACCDVQLGDTPPTDLEEDICLSLMLPDIQLLKTPISAKKFRRTSRVLTHGTFWEWMLFRWEGFKSEKKILSPWFCVAEPVQLFPSQPNGLL